MQWLPEAADFRQALREVRQALDSGASDAWQQLQALSQHRLSYLELLQLDRLICNAAAGAAPAVTYSAAAVPVDGLAAGALTGAAPADAGRIDAVPAGFTALRLAILSSCTADHLLPGIRVAALRRRLLVRGHVGQFGQVRQEARDPRFGVRQFAPQVALFCLQAREAVGAIALDATQSQVDEAIDRFLEDLRLSWRALREAHGTSIVQQNFLDTEPALFGNFDSGVPASPRRLVRRLNERLTDLARAEGVTLLDLDAASARDGLGAWFDAGRWLQARMEISPAAVPAYGEQVARILAALRGLSHKCLVLDLDNTLWGGVIGDDGLEGIVLGQGHAAGEAFLALQRYVKLLARRGVILAVCSKNEPANAEQPFLQHPDMILKREDIACFVANWEPKAGNLQRIAQELNIGLDSLVLLDDNPVERAHVRQELPMVAVPELPADPALYVNCLAGAGYFEAVGLTAEDLQRSSQYAGLSARSAAQRESADASDFLAGLDMRMRAGPAGAVDLPRVAQLINKTNQFNLTTRRHTLESVSAFAADESALVLQFRLRDRFGDDGLVSAMILVPVAGEAGTLDIDTWVMSCRVFGRQLEHAALNVAVAAARARGARRLSGTYIPTAKNGVVKDLFAELGFEAASPPDAAGITRWSLELAHYRPHVTHIAEVAAS